MTCSTCRSHREALQQIINVIDGMLQGYELDPSWLYTAPQGLTEARQLATEAILAPSSEPEDEPLGRLEVFSAEGSLLGLGDWRYTNTLNELECIPFPVIQSGKAAYMLVYAPNGTFMGECSIGDHDSDADAKINSVDLKEGGTFAIQRMTLRHTTTCPHCGKPLSGAMRQ